jgi:hypothetical protein
LLWIYRERIIEMMVSSTQYIAKPYALRLVNASESSLSIGAMNSAMMMMQYRAA